MNGRETGDDSFHGRVVEAIRAIPSGKVATYGQIAFRAGNPRASRQVAYILHSSSEKEKLPWHRVVNSKGMISLKGVGRDLQRRMLEQEGIVFNEEDGIDLKRFLWSP